MAFLPSVGFGTLMFLSTIHIAFSNILLLEVFNYTSPQIGSRVEFHCSGPAIRMRGDQFFIDGGKMIWLAGDETIARSSIIQHDQSVISEKYSVSTDFITSHGITNTYFKLQIKSVSVDDSRPYRCALYSAQDSSEVQSSPKTLHVQFPPHKIYPQCYVDYIPNDSKSVTLRCRSQTTFPPVRLNWITSRGLLSNVALKSSEGFTEINVDISIPSSDAEYTCVSNYTGDFEQISRSCTLNRPVISLDQPEEVVEGGEAVFTCSISAEPDSDHGVMWTANPSLIARNKTTSRNSNSVSTLTISNVTAQDNGTEIMCHSKNLLGENYKQKLLIVKTFGSSTGIYVPSIRVNIEPKKAEVIAGDMATFECVVSTYKSSYRYKWYYKEEEINSESESDKFLIEQIPSQRLHIRDVHSLDNNSSVSCVVMADGHKQTARARLFVITPNEQFPEESSQTDSSDPLSKYWKLIGLVSGGLVCFVLIIVFISLAVKTKRKCSRSKNQSRVHTVTEQVGYISSIGCGMNSFNNEPRPMSPATNTPSNMSTSSSSNPKTVNQERLMVNLPPIPPIPSESDIHEQENLRAAKKLEEQYEDMETVRLNFYHTRDDPNEYQHVINGLWRSNSHQDPAPVTKSTAEPLY